jgi:hypothetical protein
MSWYKRLYWAWWYRHYTYPHPAEIDHILGFGMRLRQPIRRFTICHTYITTKDILLTAKAYGITRERCRQVLNQVRRHYYNPPKPLG